jgi:Mor family transcriptional regulator
VNSTLKSIGLTKPHIYPGRKIDPAITKAILNDKSGRTVRELAKKHDVSVYYVWSLKNKQRNK